jgi:chloramphenicol O-acetyltransferase type A
VKFNQEDSIPKLVFGKYHHLNDTVKMPISIEAHHALMDGIHVAKYLDLFQDSMNNSERILEFKFQVEILRKLKFLC